MPVRMFRSKKYWVTLFAVTLINVSLSGCARNVFSSKQDGFSQGDNCLFCHVTGDMGGSNIRDFTPVYNNPGSHHPVGMEYPLGPMSRPDFNQPNGYSDGIIFFDDDSDGEIDNNDVRLFGKGNAVTVECSTCHKEHGDLTVSNRDAINHYLRVPNSGSGLCVICHQK
jgi:hypothetical protein